MNKHSQQAVIILHEIYGINEFIKDTCQLFKDAGFDVFCPNLIGRGPFLYREEHMAYDHFVKHVGFDIYKETSILVDQLKEKYERVFIIGYSIGATVAWRCCENTSCDGIISCYGSRIRDYTALNPVCPTLLLFAKRDSFNVDCLVDALKEKRLLTIAEYEAHHGFMDAYSRHYDHQASDCAKTSIFNFLSELGTNRKCDIAQKPVVTQRALATCL